MFLDIVQQVDFPLVYEFKYKLSEKGVLPCEPWTGEICGVVFVERFMNESGARLSVHYHLYAFGNLFVVLACKGFHHDAHGPDHVVAYMRSSDTFSCNAFEEIRITLAPYKLSSVEIYWVIDIHIGEIRE